VVLLLRGGKWREGMGKGRGRSRKEGFGRGVEVKKWMPIPFSNSSLRH